MNMIAEFIVSQRRLMMTLAVLLTVAGVGAWLGVPRQEDPLMPYRGAIVVVPFPGADALAVERLVVEPLEQELAEIDEIDNVESTARAGVAVVRILLRDEVYSVDDVWDDVDRSIQAARVHFPDAVAAPQFERDIWDQESVVLAITGTDDLLALRDHARELRDQLLLQPLVSRGILTADPGEQVRVTVHETAARTWGVDARMVAAQLSSRSTIIPGGAIEAGARTVVVSPQTEFQTLDEIRRTPILLPDGTAVMLSELAEVTRTVDDPVMSRMHFNGAPAVGLGLVPRQEINLVEFGRQVRGVVDAYVTLHPEIVVEYVAFQPDQVETRLSGLMLSLLQSILVVALVLVVFMGPRLGLTVTLVVPTVTAGTLAVWAGAGGELHQMSIAALVLALGMLVDNAIVVGEDVQARLDEGASRWDAAVASVRTLLVPLGTATGTTVAAFVPMLLSTGATGDFTRAIPSVVIIALVLSYVLAMTTTPIIAAMLLKARATTAAVPDDLAPTSALRWVGRLSTQHPWAIFLVTALLIAGSVSLAPQIRTQFFPASDRTLFLVDISLAAGTHIDETERVAGQLESMLLNHPDVRRVSTFIGNGAPHFYYNVISQPSQPNLSQMMVESTTLQSLDGLMAEVREFSRTTLPEAEVVARKIEQGPPVVAPVEIRLYSDSLTDLHQAATSLSELLAQTSGTVDIRHSMGLGGASIDYAVDDAVAGAFGLGRPDVALALLGQTMGIAAGQYRAGDEPIDVLVRGVDGESTSSERLTNVGLTSPHGVVVPLSAVARPELVWEPASVTHRDRTRMVTVAAQLQPGFTFSEVLERLQPQLQSEPLPASVRVEFGGELEGSGDANAALLLTLPIGLMLLLGFLMAEFNSFRQVAIIMVTVPLAGAGVIPGLVFGGQPFGFMSLLGLIALVGIVVNNAIVLLDVINHERAAGASLQWAVETAVARRIRPILLTTATTVLGLLPLALTESTLWPPLASAMISGLMASTVLTIFVIPALYGLVYRFTERGGSDPTPSIAAATIQTLLPLTVLVLVPVWSTVAVAQPASPASDSTPLHSSDNAAVPMTLDQALDHVFSQGFSVQAQQALVVQGQALQREAQARWRPQVNASVTYTLNDERIELRFPNPYAALDPWLSTVSAANPNLPPASVLTEQPDTVIVSQLQHDLRGVLTVAQPLYQPVSAPLSEQGRSVERAAQAGVEATRQGVRDAVESLWFQALRFRRLQEVAARNVELAELNYRRALQAAELGAAQVFDVRRAQYALTQAQTAVASAQAGYLAAQAQLAGALSLDSPVEPAEPPVLAADAVLQRLAISWESRPEVRASQEQSAISLAAADVARASRLPFATVSGFVIPQTTTDFQDRPVDWFVQASVQWNVWDGGVRRAQSDRLAASAAQAQWQAQDVARQLQARFEAGRYQLADAVQRQAQATQQLELATDEYEALQTAWSAGAATRLELDAALVRQFEAATLLALAQVDVQAAAYQVERMIAWE
jgi:multidrug efflux pump subunit AcrB/outer membrane protein TolC